ncbi:hypothetical protein CLOBY_27280 [Clostridium saccharobutylicum]|nr:hypothetical protein CLOBY_27280 [Clostridium saccharobutylicum]OOM18856.1 hypothetical protein CLSAB_03140 [Clostridium saccharobutylicum]
MLQTCYFYKNEVINIKIDMLEVKKDRLKEIDKQIKKAFKCKYAINLKPLYDEKKQLKAEIQKMEDKRNGRK